MEFENGSIPWMLKSVASSLLLSVLSKIDMKKDVVLSHSLIPIIDLICGYKVLKEIGVDKICKLDNVAIISAKRLVFIIKPTIVDVKKVCNWLNVLQNRDINDVVYYIVFVPRKSFDCERYLEQEGLYSNFTFLEFPIGFIPLDRDLFTLECDDSYLDYLLLGDYKFANHVIQALHQFQKLFGIANVVIHKGRASEFICENLQKLNILSGLVELNRTGPVIDLFVMDREEDYPALLLSQLNYSGILDETFAIKCGKIELDSLQNGQQTSNGGRVKHNLFAGDTVFPEVQDMSFSSVCISLKDKGQKLRQKYNERQSMNIAEMKDFLTNELRNIQSEHKTLFSHIHICESIMEEKKLYKFSDQIRVEQNLIEGNETRTSLNFLEEGIIKLYPRIQMLRLICLYSICSSGISSKELHNLIRLYTQSYGYESILSFFNLKKIGILFEISNQFNLITNSSSQKLPSYQTTAAATFIPSETIKKFRHNVKKYNLIPLLESECYNIRNPSDCGYVFGGAYYPCVCRLLGLYLDLKSSAQLDDFCKQTQCKTPPSMLPNIDGDLQTKASTGNGKRIQAVVFVGGVTFAEVEGNLRLEEGGKVWQCRDVNDQENSLVLFV